MHGNVHVREEIFPTHHSLSMCQENVHILKQCITHKNVLQL